MAPPPGPTRLLLRERVGDDDLTQLNEGNPLAWNCGMWEDLDRAGGTDVRWRVAELDGDAVGYVVVCPEPVGHDGFGAAVVNVRPHARRQGVGTALREVAEELCRGVVPGVELMYDELDPAATATLAAWGFEPGPRHHESVLDLTSLDEAVVERRGAVDGVVIDTLPEEPALGDDEWGDLHAFVRARAQETPDAGDGGGGALSLEALRGLVEEPWMMAVARDEATGALLGHTFVIRRPGEADATNTFLTGVVEHARGRGIATALKLRHALAMAEHGIARLYTQNMEGNEAILAANRTLGFTHASTYVDVRVPLPT